MARQTYYLTRDQKHPLYRTRMLTAGPIELNASAARLYRKLGVELNDEAPAALADSINEKFSVKATNAKKAPAKLKPAAKKKAPAKKKTA